MTTPSKADPFSEFLRIATSEFVPLEKEYGFARDEPLIHPPEAIIRYRSDRLHIVVMYEYGSLPWVLVEQRGPGSRSSEVALDLLVESARPKNEDLEAALKREAQALKSVLPSLLQGGAGRRIARAERKADRLWCDKALNALEAFKKDLGSTLRPGDKKYLQRLEDSLRVADRNKIEVLLDPKHHLKHTFKSVRTPQLKQRLLDLTIAVQDCL